MIENRHRIDPLGPVILHGVSLLVRKPDASPFSNRITSFRKATMRTRGSKIGMTLFGIYLLLYGGFVFLNAFAAETMERTPLPGVNLAILSGFGLIIMAFVLALIYGFLCRRTEEPAAKEKTTDDL